MRKLEIPINTEVVGYLERCNAEYETMKDNVAFIIENNIDNCSIIDSPTFKYYQDRQIEAKITYDIAKNELQERFIPQALKHHQIQWELDFRTNILTVTQLCDCEVAL